MNFLKKKKTTIISEPDYFSYTVTLRILWISENQFLKITICKQLHLYVLVVAISATVFLLFM